MANVKGPERQRLHELVDHLRSTEIALAEDYLRKLTDPFELSLLLAEPDDEPITEEDFRDFAAADERERRKERAIPHEEVLRELEIAESDLH